MLKISDQTTSRVSAKFKVLAATIITGLGLVGNAHAADAVKGEELSQTCLGCHGAPGLRNPSPVYAIPMIGGQHAIYIVSALKAYKSKERSHPTMQAQAASLSDSDMEDIAAFFSGMEGNSRPSNVNADLVAQGKEKAAVCATCHGATGDDESGNFPKLAGQYTSYLTQALIDYRSSERNNPIMSGQSSSLTLEDIKALSAYFSSQQGGLSAPQSKIFK